MRIRTVPDETTCRQVNAPDSLNAGEAGVKQFAEKKEP
jgi:hypothetical protein